MKENNNYVKNVAIDVLEYFNTLPQNKVYQDYLLKNLTPNVAPEFEWGTKFYRHMFTLSVGLFYKNNSGEPVINLIKVLTSGYKTYAKVDDFRIGDFYKENFYLENVHDYPDDIIVRDYHPGMFDPIFDSAEESKRINSTRFIAERSLSTYKERSKKDVIYVRFNDLDRILSSHNYFEEPSIKSFMEKINENFEEKINNNQGKETEYFMNRNELYDILIDVIEENERKTNIKCKSLKK